MRLFNRALVAAGALVSCAVLLSANAPAQTPDQASPPAVEAPDAAIAPPAPDQAVVPPAPPAPFALIDAPGRETVERECSVCHELSRITEHQGRSRDDWDYLIRTMAPMSEETLTEVVDYLAANYGPETGPAPAPAPTDAAPPTTEAPPAQ